jgi:type I restriction enzyme S subunit
MKTAQLGQIAKINPRLPRELTSQTSRTVHFVPMAELSEQGYVSPNGTRRLDEVMKGYTYFENGDVLVAKITPCMENGKAALVRGLEHQIAFGSTEFHVLRPTEEVDAKYLFYMIWNPVFRHQAAIKMTGSAGQKRVPTSFLEQFEIPLPKLEEQKRIVAILDKADSIRRKRQEALSHVSTLIASRFLEVFGDPVGNPRKWKLGTFDDQVTLLQYGPRFFNEAYVEADGIRIVRITDLDFQGRLDYSAMPLMDVSDEDRQKFVLKPGDLLLARSGATVGKTALIDDRAPECIAGAYFIRMRFKDAVRPLYVQMVLRSKLVQQMIASRSQQSAQQNFNGPAIRALPLPVPPIELQDQFIQFHAAAISLGERMATQSGESDALFNSLVQRAFKGEL